MSLDFLKVAVATPKIKVADPIYNAKVVVSMLGEAWEQGANLIAFPELCLTGSTCGDLFRQEILLEEAKNALVEVKNATQGKSILTIVGLPFLYGKKIYNVAALLWDGKILGLVPKRRGDAFFANGQDGVNGKTPNQVVFGEEYVSFHTELVLQGEVLRGITVGVEFEDDLWDQDAMNTKLANKGANVIVCMGASCEMVGRTKKRREKIVDTSKRLTCGYIYSNAGEGESTQDMVFGGQKLICEDGVVLEEAKPFSKNMIYGAINLARLICERAGRKVFPEEFEGEEEILEVKASPFIPSNKEERDQVCEEILQIQSYGLKKRYEHIGCKSAVIGISGGLDSTLALLVTARAFDLLGLPRENIRAITMPCFGTTNRTYENACTMAKAVGATLQEVDIKASVLQHFKDINQDVNSHDVTYENAQARERTQVLMDIANQCGALVIGTGDLSELVLGWATYNGDHMSMYGVNAGIPKTLIRVLVDYIASNSEDRELAAVLKDVLDTPVSPELLPPSEGEISQKTEDLVGPYELHDFFLYYVLRHGFAPKKIYQMACKAFEGEYSEEVILKWLKNFYHRFFAQQFKRSCLPDGPRVGSVSVSPRGGLNMPSDACATIWKAQLENL